MIARWASVVSLAIWPALALADTAERGTWRASSIWGALGGTVIFAVTGILLVVFGFKLFDWLTPGDLQGQVIEKQNVAAGILSGAVVLGICIIVAVSML